MVQSTAKRARQCWGALELVHNGSGPHQENIICCYSEFFCGINHQVTYLTEAGLSGSLKIYVLSAALAVSDRHNYADNAGRKIGRIRYFFWKVSCMFGMWIKKWSRIRGIVRHTVCMVLPIALLFEQNLPPFRALSADVGGSSCGLNLWFYQGVVKYSVFTTPWLLLIRFLGKFTDLCCCPLCAPCAAGWVLFFNFGFFSFALGSFQFSHLLEFFSFTLSSLHFKIVLDFSYNSIIDKDGFCPYKRPLKKKKKKIYTQPHSEAHKKRA